MPSSVEVLEPSEISMDVAATTSFLNTLSGRLHRYDDIAKLAQFQIQNLSKKLQSLTGQNQQQLMRVTPIEQKPVKVKLNKPEKKPKKSSKKKR
jgi:hypothetical protein